MMHAVDFWPPATCSAGSLHTAALLKSGRVLIAGGDQGIAINGYSALNGAELFDPVAGAIITYPLRSLGATTQREK